MSISYQEICSDITALLDEVPITSQNISGILSKFKKPERHRSVYHCLQRAHGLSQSGAREETLKVLLEESITLLDYHELKDKLSSDNPTITQEDIEKFRASKWPDENPAKKDLNKLLVELLQPRKATKNSVEKARKKIDTIFKASELLTGVKVLNILAKDYFTKHDIELPEEGQLFLESQISENKDHRVHELLYNMSTTVNLIVDAIIIKPDIRTAFSKLGNIKEEFNNTVILFDKDARVPVDINSEIYHIAATFKHLLILLKEVIDNDRKIKFALIGLWWGFYANVFDPKKGYEKSHANNSMLTNLEKFLGDYERQLDSDQLIDKLNHNQVKEAQQQEEKERLEKILLVNERLEASERAKIVQLEATRLEAAYLEALIKDRADVIKQYADDLTRTSEALLKNRIKQNDLTQIMHSISEVETQIQSLVEEQIKHYQYISNLPSELGVAISIHLDVLKKYDSDIDQKCNLFNQDCPTLLSIQAIKQVFLDTTNPLYWKDDSINAKKQAWELTAKLIKEEKRVLAELQSTLDQEKITLEQSLSDIHQAFFEKFDGALAEKARLEKMLQDQSKELVASFQKNEQMLQEHEKEILSLQQKYEGELTAVQVENSKSLEALEKLHESYVEEAESQKKGANAAQPDRVDNNAESNKDKPVKKNWFIRFLHWIRDKFRNVKLSIAAHFKKKEKNSEEPQAFENNEQEMTYVSVEKSLSERSNASGSEHADDDKLEPKRSEEKPATGKKVSPSISVAEEPVFEDSGISCQA